MFLNECGRDNTVTQEESEANVSFITVLALRSCSVSHKTILIFSKSST